MKERPFIAMTWETVDRDFGPEPGVFWDRDFAKLEWQPLLYSSLVGTKRELRAHCPLHRAPDSWPLGEGHFGLVMRCLCLRWQDDHWEPRFGEDVRAEALDAQVSGLINYALSAGSVGTEPFICAALEDIPGVLRGELVSAPRGSVAASIVVDAYCDAALVEIVARALMPRAVSATASWKLSVRVASEAETHRLESDPNFDVD